VHLEYGKYLSLREYISKRLNPSSILLKN